jgi:translation initiation factor 2 beta subunit (eIF-2beta)/eIF-5
MSDLATVEYTVTKIIKASDNKTWFKLGERKILMSCEAHIKAGIDMSAIDKNSFKVADKSVEVTLPPPKVISISIPPEGIKTEYEDISIFRDKFKASDRDALAAQAQNQIKNSIESLGILDQAKANTAFFVTNFLKKLGYENISINYDGKQSLNKMQ